jgi:hypothetical protein
MKNIMMLIFLVLIISCFTKYERPNSQLLPHVMAAPQLIDRGKLDLLNILKEDTAIVINVKGIVETDSSFTLVSILKSDHEIYKESIKKYLNTIKFIPAHYYRDKKAFRQEWVMPLTLRRR